MLVITPLFSILSTIYTHFEEKVVDTQSYIISKLCFMACREEMKVKEPSRGSCLSLGHSSSSVWDVTSCAEFNQEGHRVCLAHKTTDSLAFSPAPLNPILLFPVQIYTEAAASVRFSYSINCQVLESDQSRIVKRLRSTPQLLTIQRGYGANPPPLGVVMGAADYPCVSQPFGPTHKATGGIQCRQG